ncbi:MAG: hypothetical protein IIA11_06580 [Proteobacteria bacterium]|nr:hypothetical protein [Pseudomonadota bacterium]
MAVDGRQLTVVKHRDVSAYLMPHALAKTSLHLTTHG